MPCSLTAANLAAGFAAMILAATGRFEAAVYALCLAILLDMLDGRVARSLCATSEFGRELDSFSDACSFGVAPAFMAYFAVLDRFGVAGIALAVAYMLAGMFRLVRYNLLSDAHSKARRTMGLPIPIAASYLMAVVLMRDQAPPWLAAVVVLFVTAGMTTRWQLPELKGAGPVTFLMTVGIANYIAFVVWPNWYTVGWWTVWNVCIVFAARTEDRKLAIGSPVGR